MKKKTLLSLLISISFVLGCHKQKHTSEQISNQTTTTKQTTSKIKPSEEQLTFKVKNKTGKTIYVSCFSYIKEHDFTRWRWSKSPAYRLQNNEIIDIVLPPIPDKEDRKSIFGELAVYDGYVKAEYITHELMADQHKIDLDLIHNLQGIQVEIEVERYGLKGEKFKPDFIQVKKEKEKVPELDFVVENQTGKTILLTCFVLQRRYPKLIWRINKTPVIRLEPEMQALVDVDTIVDLEDRNLVRGHLGIFEQDEKEKAEKSTYELLEPKNRVKLGTLSKLKHNKIVLSIDHYGLKGPIIQHNIRAYPSIQTIIE